jgi:hypothetical protein
MCRPMTKRCKFDHSFPRHRGSGMNAALRYGLKIRVSLVRFRPRPPVSMRPSARLGSWGVSTTRARFLQKFAMNQHEGNASDPWDQLVAITNELENSYWVPMLSTPFDMLDKLVAKSVNEEVPTLHKALETFRTNLFAAKELLELPYMLVAPLIPEVMQKAKQFKGQATNGGLPPVSRTLCLAL